MGRKEEGMIGKEDRWEDEELKGREENRSEEEEDEYKII